MGLNDGKRIQASMYGNSLECQIGLVDSNCVTEPSDDVWTEVPSIVPCYNGKTLKIHGEIVVNGLCAISIKHHKGNCKEEKRSGDDANENKATSVDETGENVVENESHQKKLAELGQKTLMTPEVPECLKGRMKVWNWLPLTTYLCRWVLLVTAFVLLWWAGKQRRNSFWNVHRPELSKLTWPENFVSSAVLQDFFHNHLRFHGTFCEPLHDYTNRSSLIDEEFRDFSKLREIVPPRILPPDERVVNIMEKSRSVQLNDEDLDPETMVHKSRAEFCVTIGEYVRRPPLKRTTSQQMPRCIVQPANRFESLPIQHENLLSKEVLNSEERVSSIIGNQDFYKNQGVCKKLGSGAVLRTASLVDGQHTPAASLPSISNHSTNQYNSHLMEDSGDPARLRTILSPRDEENEETLPPSV